ncbi:hypothetical protein PG993_011438 [Apiospora rasikravindrae]|uniref:Uncharacterized protein n=1 Tax=Apiospora rasikravindrae TaxID=990691 RepID=A0ABR1SGK8_9PEZI
MIFNKSLLTCVATIASISSVLATPAPAPDGAAAVNPRQISLGSTPLFDSIINPHVGEDINSTIHFQVFLDESSSSGTTTTAKHRRSPSIANLFQPAEKRALCTQAEQDDCLPQQRAALQPMRLLTSAASRVPGNGNSVCIAKVVQGAATTYCCAHTSQRVAGLTYGDLLAPTTQMIDECVAPNSEQGRIRRLSLFQRNACVSFCLDNKPTGCT